MISNSPRPDGASVSMTSNASGPQEVDADRDQVALRLGRLLLEADDAARRHRARRRRTAPGRGRGRAAFPRPTDRPRTRRRRRGERRPAQDVVAEDAAERVVADEVPGEPDRVGDAERAALVAIGQVEPEMGAVGQQLDDVADALAADDDHHLADPHPGERLDRVVDHRPVVDRQEVLVRDDRQREEPRRRPAGEDDALHARQGSRGVALDWRRCGRLDAGLLAARQRPPGRCWRSRSACPPRPAGRRRSRGSTRT